MFPAFLLAKLFRTKNIAAYTTTKSPTSLHGSQIFLRRISSNRSCAQLSTLVSPSVADSVSSKRLGKSSLTKKELNRDYTVSYLVESCGLSPKDALSASKKIHFGTPERPNAVLDLLSNHGFTRTQIANTVRLCPGLLIMDAEKTILPKLQFFQSIGFSKVALAQVLSYNPIILSRSLKNQIERCCYFIKSLVQSDERFCSSIKRSPWILLTDYDKFLVPNIAILQQAGVPRPSISLLLTHHPRIIVRKPKQLSAYVSKVKEMGFDPSKTTFVLALQFISGKSSQMIWDRCNKIYTKWGWSEEDIISAFKKHPHCMMMSKKKLDLAMEFLMNTMGWSSECIAQNPTVILFSLEKRTIPRCSVIRVLWTKGLLSKDLSPGAVLMPAEEIFLKRYVTKYEEQVPQLLSVYKGEMDALDL